MSRRDLRSPDPCHRWMGHSAAGSSYRGRLHRSLLIVLLAFLPAGPASAADVQTMKGNPFRGRELLSQKLCTQCHAVWGHGGMLGPDISTAVTGKSWLDLVGDFWNHTPSMIDAMAGKGHPWPTLDHGEMADLLSYLYYLRLFDEPGDAANGSATYSQLQCGNCHSLAGHGGDQGGPLDRFSAYPSSVMLAQAMWNAGPAMQREQLGRGADIPTFSRKEMADIQAYIRARALREGGEIELLPLPDPDRGSEVFKAKRCGACHGTGRREGPDLARLVVDMTVSEISGILWNHSYKMTGRMQARGIPFPRFEGTEMADLISYLHFLGFLRESGDAWKGRSIFEQKGCVRCHEGPGAAAKSLSGNQVARDPIALSAAMWNHAPEMHLLMADQAVAWPKFDIGDMGNLAAYLRSVSSPASQKER